MSCLTCSRVSAVTSIAPTSVPECWADQRPSLPRVMVHRYFIGRHTLMRHHMEYDVDTQRIRFFLREFGKIPWICPLLFPTIAQIRVMANEHHEPALVVHHPAIVRR